MTRATLLSAILVAIASGQTPSVQIPGLTQPGSLTGAVHNAITGEPVKDAVILVRPADESFGPTAFTTRTDTAGKYSFRGLEPGGYYVSVDTIGFRKAQYGAKGRAQRPTPLAVKAGQSVTGIDFKLSPPGVVSGTVRDEAADPVSGAQVLLLQPQYFDGAGQLSTAGAATTNDLGEYRLFGLAAGHYYVSITNSRTAGAPNSRPGFSLPAYYPGTLDPQRATMLEVAPGAVLQGIDVKFAKPVLVRVRGQVRNETAVQGAQITLALIPRSQVAGQLGSIGLQAGAGGRFEFEAVAPGSYLLTAVLSDGTRSIMGYRALDVGATDIDDASVTVRALVSVPGAIRTEAGTVNLSGAQISLRSVERPGAITLSNPAADGRFVFDNVVPDRYLLAVDGLPQGMYLKSARFGEQDVTDGTLEVTANGTGPLQVTLSGNSAQLTGTVTAEDRSPASNAVVVLVPEGPARRKLPRLYKVSVADFLGRYTVQNIEPGTYKIFAWDEIDQGAWLAPEFLRGVESKGRVLQVREGSREKVDLKALGSPE